MTVSEFCHKCTEYGQLIIIRDKGTVKGSVWINERGTSLVPIQYSNEYVRNNEWGFINVARENGDFVDIPCKFIDV